MVKPYIRLRPLLLLLGCLFIGGFSSKVLDAEELDRMAYLPVETATTEGNWLARPLLKLSGTIKQFDTQQLEITVAGETQPTRVRAERIVWVVPAWSDNDARQGLVAYREGQWPQAIAGLFEALKKRPPVWRQEWLSVLLANAAFEAGRFPAAFELIAQLDRKPLPIPMLAQLPIVWHGRVTEPTLLSAAEAQLAAPEPLVRLAAASVLIASENPNAAKQVLLQLAADAQRPLVARLADAQLWRRATLVETKQQLGRWLEKIEQLPPGVITGPLATVADRLENASDTEQAVEFWLAVALLAEDPSHPRARSAKENAARLLKSLGRDEEAERLYTGRLESSGK